jgi:GDPmannose 4,6-dehydratase
MYLMMLQDVPDDYVIATGEQHSVREFVELAFAEIGVALRWEGSGTEEVGIVDTVDLRRLTSARRGHGDDPTPADGEGPVRPGAVVLRIDPRYYRPTEVESLIGDATKARERLGWSPTVGFRELVIEMVHDDLAEARRDDLLKRRGFEVKDYKE